MNNEQATKMHPLAYPTIEAPAASVSVFSATEVSARERTWIDTRTAEETLVCLEGRLRES